MQISLQKLSLEPKEPHSKYLPRISEFPMSDISKSPRPESKLAHRFAQEKDHPSIYREFVECSSRYDLPYKEDSDEISDNQEFDDARRLKTLD